MEPWETGRFAVGKVREWGSEHSDELWALVLPRAGLRSAVHCPAGWRKARCKEGHSPWAMCAQDRVRAR